MQHAGQCLVAQLERDFIFHDLIPLENLFYRLYGPAHGVRKARWTISSRPARIALGTNGEF
jgi:hypothetical protein